MTEETKKKSSFKFEFLVNKNKDFKEKNLRKISLYKRSTIFNPRKLLNLIIENNKIEINILCNLR